MASRDTKKQAADVGARSLSEQAARFSKAERFDMMSQAKITLADWLALPRSEQENFGNQLDRYLNYFWTEADRKARPTRLIRDDLNALLSEIDTLRWHLGMMDEATIGELNAAKRKLSYQADDAVPTSRDTIRLPHESRSVSAIRQAVADDLALLGSYAAAALDDVKLKVKRGAVEAELKSLLVTIAASLCKRFIGVQITNLDCYRSQDEDGAVYEGDVHAFTLKLFEAFGFEITPDSAGHQLRALTQQDKEQFSG